MPTTYELRHRKYYHKTRKYTDAITRYLKKYPIPPSIYEKYIDEEDNWIDIEPAYLAISIYVNMLKTQQMIERQLNIDV